MQTRINGKAVPVEDGIHLERLVVEMQLSPKRVVVEVNGRIVPREQWPTQVLQEEDEIEIVSFVAGG